ncbi:MAG: peptidylprolyl isomerase [Candidatus Omnitrophica bacterium]|nr:peptidylprolyl isomerase [Candidatus Omnitrophota bacterium]
MKKTSVFIFFFILLVIFSFCSSQNQTSGNQQISLPKKEEYIGEFFGIQVPKSNYNFVKAVIMIFGNHFGPQPQTEKELEDAIWDQLLLSYEAYRRNIQVSQEELEKEITATLKSEKVDFDWKQDKIAYGKWLKEKINVPIDFFENQLRHLIQLRKLRQAIMDEINPEVKEEEAYQEFLNEQNTLGIELVQFDKREDAEDFYKKVRKNPKLWEQEKEKRPKDFKRPGFVALEFLMEMWKLPKDVVYKMMQMKIGEIHSPAPIYRGYGVFKVLEQRPAELSRWPQQKDSYYEQIKMKKKYDGFKEWFENLKKQANIKIYSKDES